MPAKNPRLTITLEPTTSAQLRRISELTGNSQSALISELLTGTSEVFQRLIVVLEAANDAKSSLRGLVAEDLAKVQAQVEQRLGIESFNLALEQTLPLFEDVVQRRSRKASGDAGSARATSPSSGRSTPLSNRGVRSTTKVGKSSRKSRG